MPQFAPLVIGGLGLLEQSQANNAMQSQADQERALQQQLIDAQLGNYNNYMDTVKALDREGAFNPAQRLALLNRQAGYDLNNTLSSEAGAARALGYRPGDTTPVQEMNQSRGNFQLQQEQEANQIMNEAYANHLAALQGAPNPAGNGAIQATGQQYEFDTSRQQPLGPVLSALAPYLQSLGKAPSAQAGTAAAPTPSASPLGNWRGFSPYEPGYGPSTNPFNNWPTWNSSPGLSLTKPSLQQSLQDETNPFGTGNSTLSWL